MKNNLEAIKLLWDVIDMDSPLLLKKGIKMFNPTKGGLEDLLERAKTNKKPKCEKVLKKLLKKSLS